MDDLHINGWLRIPASELEVRAVRSAGPGGQNVNKVSSKIELRWSLANTTVLVEPVRERLRELVRTRLDNDGVLLLTSQLTRDQHRNLEDARQKLAELVRRALVPPKPRHATRPTRGSVERRLTEKKRTAQKKDGRRGSGDD